MINKDNEEQEKLEGIMSQGYGIVPKLVMRDTDIDAEAKAIYAYLCSFAGNKDTAFPSVSLMCHDLGFSERRFYKYRKQLIEKEYISITKERDGNKWKHNIYHIHR